MGTKCSNENMFLPSGRKECAGCVGGHFVYCWCEAGPRSRKIQKSAIMAKSENSKI